MCVSHFDELCKQKYRPVFCSQDGVLYSVPFLFPHGKRWYPLLLTATKRVIFFQNGAHYGVLFLFKHMKRWFPLSLNATRIVFCSQNGVLYGVPFLFPHVKDDFLYYNSVLLSEWCAIKCALFFHIYKDDFIYIWKLIDRSSVLKMMC